MTFIGCVDTLSDTYICGWAADNEDLTRAVCVDVAVNSQVAATVCCAEFREDLTVAGIGDGWKGFHYDPSAHFKAGRNAVEVRYAGTDIPVHKGRGQWVRSRPPVGGGRGAFLAALEAYHEFKPQDHICWIGEGAEDFERVLAEAQVPFRKYTALVQPQDPAAIELPEKADLVICAAECLVSPEWVRRLVNQHMDVPSLLAVCFGESPDAAAQMRKTLEDGGVCGLKFESVACFGKTDGICAFAEVNGPPPPVGKPAPVLAHIHVPKCAGTSLRVLLERHFGARHLRLYVDDTYFVYGQETLRSYLLQAADVVSFSSHHVRVFPRWLGGRELLYVTFLRDPVEQFISYMTHIKKYYAGITSKSLLEAVPQNAPQLSLREFARWLLTQERDIPFRENHNVNFFSRHSFPGAVDRLEAAKTALSGFLFVGITEKMEESMARLRELAGVDFPTGPMLFENTSNDYRDDLSWIHPQDEVGSLLLRSVELDRQLYEWALARL